MYSATQLHYLQAMGIPAWQSRHTAASPRQPAADLILAEWLHRQPLQITVPGQVALWGSSESGLLVLSECLPESDSGAPVTQPFYGPHGKMLDAMLKGINLSRRRCNITALVDSASTDEGGGLLSQLLDQLKPRLVLFFCFPGGCGGRVDFSDNLQRGLLQVGPSPCIVSYHPYYLLDHPESKRDAWEDLKRVRQLLGTG